MLALSIVAPALACSDVTVVFPEGGGTAGLSGEPAAAEAEAPGTTPDNPLRGSRYTIQGDAEGLRLGGGALLALPATGEHPAQLIVGAPGDPAEGVGAGSVALHTLGTGASAAYTDAESLMMGAAGTSFGCGGLVLHRHAMIAIGACTRSAEAGEQLGAVYLFDYETLAEGGVSWQTADGRIEGAVEFVGRSLLATSTETAGPTLWWVLPTPTAVVAASTSTTTSSPPHGNTPATSRRSCAVRPETMPSVARS